MVELNTFDLEQVDGGVLPLIVAVVVADAGLIAAMIGMMER
jgi:lactobin A/cerein 7B family class IIb bacteriocin